MHYIVWMGLALMIAACGHSTSGDASRLDSSSTARQPAAANVDDSRLVAAGEDTANWMTYGRTYDEQRFSPLEHINAGNVTDLKLAWHYDLDTAHRGQEATPLVIDGVMYVTSAWSKVFAIDARTGKELWKFDPRVPPEVAIDACCDVVNRGVAIWRGKVFLGALDGRLIALDAATGKEVWSELTVDPELRYTITGAPRIVKGKVIIGNSGADMGVRGYVSAYDAETGKLVWRFYTVPGDPAKPFENPILEKAAKTWTGEWWKFGGGGTAWDSLVYDAKLDLLYIGVGNGSPWNHKVRSPQGGDNLFLSSIVAVRPDTGEYVWHYQTTPGETWDYTAVQQMILADLTIDGRSRQVLMQAPKNGFFYVLDRATGELISAKPFVRVNWATGIDMKTGRPIENPQARYDRTGKTFMATPGPGGAHSWQAMSFSPLTKLVYIPVTESWFPFTSNPDGTALTRTRWNSGADFNASSMPQDRAVKLQAFASTRGHLAAWDPIAQREVWRAQYEAPWFGGTLATAGNLVFHGTAHGEIVAYQADTGAKLWSAPTQAGVVAPPVSYSVGGEQFIALEVGWGGGFALTSGEIALKKHIKSNLPRVLAFKLGGTDALPPVPARSEPRLQPPPDRADVASITRGKALYHAHCMYCHGDSAVSGGILPDLRHSPMLNESSLWQRIVHDGLYKDRGMIGFAPDLSQEDVEHVRAYVIRRAHEGLAEEAAGQLTGGGG